MAQNQVQEHGAASLNVINQQYSSDKLDKLDKLNKPDKLNKQQEDKPTNIFDKQQINQYFNKVQKGNKVSHTTIQLAGTIYSGEGIQNIVNDIQNGKTNVQQKQNNINDYIDKYKIKEEEQRTIQLKLKKEEILRQLEYLEVQTSGNAQTTNKAINANPQLFTIQFKPPNILSKSEHEAYMEKILKNREQANEKHQRYVEKLERKRQQQEKREKQLQEHKINHERLKRRKRISTTLQKKKQQHLKVLAQSRTAHTKFEEVLKKKFLHEEIEEKYNNQIYLPALEEQKKKLKQIREISKGFSINEIIKHEKQYLQKRDQSLSMAKSKAQEEDWHYQPPEKTKKLTQFLSKQKQDQKKQLQQKKRKIDEKISRQENFVSSLKDKYVPKIDENKQRQIEMRLLKQKQSKRKQSTIDSKTLGISYLQQIKRLRKKTIDRPETEKQLSTLRSTQRQRSNNKHNYTNYLTVPHDNQYYETKRRKRIDQVEKIKKLKIQSDRINQELRRKQQLKKFNKNITQQDQDDAVQLLLTGIRTKMGIMNVYRNSIQ